MIDPNAPLALSNGATPLELHWADLEHRGANDPGGVVLARTDGPEPYATWEFVRRPDGQTHCFTGRYFRHIWDAAADYRERIGPASEPVFPLSVMDVVVLDEILDDWQDLSSSAIEQIPGAMDLVARLGAWLTEHEAWRNPECATWSRAEGR